MGFNSEWLGASTVTGFNRECLWASLERINLCVEKGIAGVEIEGFCGSHGWT
jgi:hypothetical protein